MQAGCYVPVVPRVWRLAAAARRVLLLALLAVILSACTTRFLYNKIDTFIIWKVNGFVSLTADQKEALKTDIQTLLDAARLNDMPRVAALLDDVAREFETGPVTATQIDQRYRDFMTEYDAFMLSIVPPTERFLRGLSDEQIEELFANLDEVNDEMYEEYSGRTPEEREANRNKSAIRGMQNFTGRLTDEQQLLITDALARMEDASEQWIEYQRLWQQQFRQLVTARPPAPEYERRLTTLLVYPRSLHSAEYLAIVESNRVILNDMLSELFTGLTERQRTRLVRKVDDYAELLRGLAEAG